VLETEGPVHLVSVLGLSAQLSRHTSVRSDDGDRRDDPAECDGSDKADLRLRGRLSVLQWERTGDRHVICHHSYLKQCSAQRHLGSLRSAYHQYAAWPEGNEPCAASPWRSTCLSMKVPFRHCQASCGPLSERARNFKQKIRSYQCWEGGASAARAAVLARCGGG
jgi:hypothetical protein